MLITQHSATTSGLSTKNVLIVGATGFLGSAAAHHFIDAGFRVRCLVRSKDKAKSLMDKGAEIIVGNIADRTAVEEACKNTVIVITAAHAMLGRGKNSSANIDEKAHKKLIDVAVQARVQHFIYSSVYGASATHPIDFFRNKFSVEQYLMGSGLNYTILRLPAFMERHVHNILGRFIVEKNKGIILGQGRNPANFIAVDDVVQTLDLIVGNKAYFNRILNIAGPENLTRNEVIQIYARQLNITPKVSHVPVWLVNLLSKLVRPFHPGIARIMRFGVYAESSDETMNTGETIKQFGLKPTTVEMFVKTQIQSAKNNS